VTAKKDAQLEQTLADIQKRWGEKAIRRLSEQRDSTPLLPTGFAELDQIVGGIPRGRISEIVGAPGSGMTTLALKIIARAQAGGGIVVYLDGEQTFDPEYAHCCGVRLEQLFLARTPDSRLAIDLLPDFIVNGGIDLFVHDLPWGTASEPATMNRLATTLGRLIAPLSQSGCALLFLMSLPAGATSTVDGANGYPPHATLPHYAALRLLIQKERWLYRRRDVAGYEAQVVVVKNKLAAAGQRVRIVINISGDCHFLK
jgi:recombination protein RecA